MSFEKLFWGQCIIDLWAVWECLAELRGLVPWNINWGKLVELDIIFQWKKRTVSQSSLNSRPPSVCLWGIHLSFNLDDMTSSGMNGLAIQVVVQEAYVSDLHQTIMCKVAVDMCGGVKLSSLTWNFICGPAHYNHFYFWQYFLWE